MNLEELRSEFIVSDDAFKVRLEVLIKKALAHCRIDKNGVVSILDTKLSALNQVRLVLSARWLASQLDESINSTVSLAEIVKSTGLQKDQVRARANDAVKAKFAESPSIGNFRALAHRIEPFLDSLLSGSASESKMVRAVAAGNAKGE